MNGEFNKMTMKELLVAKANLEISIGQMLRERIDTFQKNTGTKVAAVTIEIKASASLAGQNFVLSGIVTHIVCPMEGGEFVTLS